MAYDETAAMLLIENGKLKAEVERLEGVMEPWRNLAKLLEGDVATLRADNERLRAALKRWENSGCPDCGGDCSSANPPVACCIMQETRAALAREKQG